MSIIHLFIGAFILPVVHGLMPDHWIPLVMVNKKLASPKEYQPKTEHGKRAKEKKDALKEPVEIAERMEDASNCEVF